MHYQKQPKNPNIKRNLYNQKAKLPKKNARTILSLIKRQFFISPLPPTEEVNEI